jgi:hypothetical protein
VHDLTILLALGVSGSILFTIVRSKLSYSAERGMHALELLLGICGLILAVGIAVRISHKPTAEVGRGFDPDPRMATPYSQQASAGAEFLLAKSLTLRADYLFVRLNLFHPSARSWECI